ncbi:hypothetical protein ACJD0Z_02770 [Flavobacteriaceae bacterium M23B6Z8]
MKLNHPDSISILNEVAKLDLYKELVKQLQKDFTYANTTLDISPEISPEDLHISLLRTIYDLISYKFGEYLNLLYIIDVSEKQIKEIASEDISEITKQVVLLILKREWQKVWYRKKYS